MQHLTADDVRQRLVYPGLVEALRRAHAAGAMPDTHRQIVNDPHDNKFVSLTSWTHDERNSLLRSAARRFKTL